MSNNESNDTLLKIHLSEHESKYVKFKKKKKILYLIYSSFY